MQITFSIMLKNNPFLKMKLKKKQKWFPAVCKLACANIIKMSITSQELSSYNFWQIAKSVLSKTKSAIPPLLTGPEVLSPVMFTEIFSKNSNLDDSCPSLLSMTNLKLHIFL